VLEFRVCENNAAFWVHTKIVLLQHLGCVWKRSGRCLIATDSPVLESSESAGVRLSCTYREAIVKISAWGLKLVTEMMKTDFNWMKAAASIMSHKLLHMHTRVWFLYSSLSAYCVSRLNRIRQMLVVSCTHTEWHASRSDSHGRHVWHYLLLRTHMAPRSFVMAAVLAKL